MNIGKRLKILITKKGITAYMLANELKISTSTISRISTKKAKPNRKTLELLANYFNVDKYWLLTGKAKNQNIEKGNKELEVASIKKELTYKDEIIRMKDKLLDIQEQEIIKMREKLLTIQGREKEN